MLTQLYSPALKVNSSLRIVTQDYQNGKQWFLRIVTLIKLRNKICFYNCIRSSTGVKNVSAKTIVDHDTAINSVGTANNLGAAFSKNKKEKAYHLTNSSGINMQNSYKTLDCPEKNEGNLFPATKNGAD